MKFHVRTALAGLIFSAALSTMALAQTPQSTGFGSGTGMGAGGIAGSVGAAHTMGFDVKAGGSGLGSQTFGGGFDRQQYTGAGPLATGGSSSGSGYSATPVLSQPAQPTMSGVPSGR